MSGTIDQQNFRKILFCTDFSENADHAFEFAVRAAVRNVGSQLHLLHVIPEPPAQFWKGYIYGVDEDVDERARREIDAKLAVAYRPRIPEGISLVIAMQIGEAGQQILGYARDQQADLIIMGRQGAGTVGKLFFGNVTERVIRKSTCPVLVIPPRGKESQTGKSR
ncbi:MAG: universal stress protein [Verrucomicrobiota bacterium]|jgi:nucleotide-binding universal stress UspA family protein|nr:universal stress protein [Verrucomicrobiota bacterium]